MGKLRERGGAWTEQLCSDLKLGLLISQLPRSLPTSSCTFSAPLPHPAPSQITASLRELRGSCKSPSPSSFTITARQEASQSGGFPTSRRPIPSAFYLDPGLLKGKPRQPLSEPGGPDGSETSCPSPGGGVRGGAPVYPRPSRWAQEHSPGASGILRAVGAATPGAQLLPGTRGARPRPLRAPPLPLPRGPPSPALPRGQMARRLGAASLC